MAKSKSKITPIQREYKKQVKRIKQFVTRAEKRGYVFSENVLPDVPKRITQASVNRLAKLTPEKLYQKAEYGGSATFGEIVKGTEGVKAERHARAKKSAQTRKMNQGGSSHVSYHGESSHGLHQAPTFTPDYEPPINVNNDVSFFDLTVISGFKEHINQLNENAKNILSRWFDNILATNDTHDVAIMLEEGAQAGYIVTWEIAYDEDKLFNYMSDMLDYLPESGELYKAEIMDAMEQEEDFNPVK